MLRSQSESFQYAPSSPLMVDEARATENMFGPWTLSPEQIDAPAFFVDEHLSIQWMAPYGRDPFSMALAKELSIASSRNVFNLLLRPSIKHAIADWQSFFSFVYKCLHRGSLSTIPPLADISMRQMGNETVLRKIDDNTDEDFLSTVAPSARTSPPANASIAWHWIKACCLCRARPLQTSGAFLRSRKSLPLLDNYPPSNPFVC